MANPIDLHPIGYISMHAGDHDAYGIIRPWIWTDLGWRACDGMFYNRHAYPRLWTALPDRRRGDEVQVPNLSNEGKPFGNVVHLTPAQMPPHSHTIAPLHELRDNARFDPYFMQRHSHGYIAGFDPAVGQWKPQPVYKNVRLNREDVLGTVESVSSTPAGLEVKMKLHDHFTEMIKKSMVDTADLQSLFPEFHGIKGMKWGQSRTSTSNNKENTMSVTKLKTPTEDIERKDLTVAMRLVGTPDKDDLLHALALVQELGDNQTLYRANELADADVLGQRVRLDGKKVEGVLTDVQSTEAGYHHADIRLVIDGKIEVVKGHSYVVVSDDPEPLGEDTLRVVRD